MSTRVGRSRPSEQLDRRGLAGAVRPQQADHLATGDVEVEIVDPDGETSSSRDAGSAWPVRVRTPPATDRGTRSGRSGGFPCDSQCSLVADCTRALEMKWGGSARTRATTTFEMKRGRRNRSRPRADCNRCAARARGVPLAARHWPDVSVRPERVAPGVVALDQVVGRERRVDRQLARVPGRGSLFHITTDGSLV